MSNAPWNKAPWGPPAVYAVIPVAAVLFGSWIAVATIGAGPEAGTTTVLKPLPDGSFVEPGSAADAFDAANAIEVRYGVPTPRTVHLWK